MAGHHPISDTCLGALVEQPRGEPFSLPDLGADVVRRGLKALLQAPDLEDAVLSIVQLAQLVAGPYRSPTAGAALLHIAAEVATPTLMLRGGRALEQLQTSAAQLSQFEGRDAVRFVPPSAPGDGQTKASPLSRFTMNVPSSKKPG